METLKSYGGNTFFVELSADIETRKSRNKTENRAAHKPHVIPITEATLESWENKYVLNSSNDFFYPESHLKIHNSNLSAEATASQIINHFALTAI